MLRPKVKNISQIQQNIFFSLIGRNLLKKRNDFSLEDSKKSTQQMKHSSNLD
jgi:hypothetical protein